MLSDNLEISKIMIHSKLQEPTFNLFLSMYKLSFVLFDVQLYKRRRKKSEIIIIKQILKSDDTNVVPLSENSRKTCRRTYLP